MQTSNGEMETGGGSTLIGTRVANASARRFGTTATWSELATIIGSTCKTRHAKGHIPFDTVPCQIAVDDRMRHSRCIGDGVLCYS